MKPHAAYLPETRVLCMRIVPTSGTTLYVTEYVTDLTMYSNGDVYLSLSGHQFTGYAATAAFSPASLDIEGICNMAHIDRAAIASGVYDGARVYIFATVWDDPTHDDEPIMCGILGKATIRDDRYVISCTSLVDVLAKTVGRAYTAKCQKKFCGTEYAGCGVDLAANTEVGSLTFVMAAHRFADSFRTEADDTFGAGTILFTTGPNAGLKPLDIKSYSVTGVIETFEPFYYLPTVGDEYEMVRGCRKRSVDCKNRWNGTTFFSNILNFGGFEYIPTNSQYSYIGKTSIF